MDELIVEGLCSEDFKVLEKILKTYKVSLSSDITFEELASLYNKVKQIVDYLSE
jgi:hypothetical protein